MGFFDNIPIFTVTAGVTMATLGVAIFDDAIFEGDESFTVEISNLSFGVIGNGATQVDITDDDGEWIPMEQIMSFFHARNFLKKRCSY